MGRIRMKFQKAISIQNDTRRAANSWKLLLQLILLLETIICYLFKIKVSRNFICSKQTNYFYCKKKLPCWLFKVNNEIIFLQMNTNIPSATATTNPTAPVQLTKVVPINIGDKLCFPKFTCIHLTFPGQDQLKRNLTRYSKKMFLFICSKMQITLKCRMRNCTPNYSTNNKSFWLLIRKIMILYKFSRISMKETDNYL